MSSRPSSSHSRRRRPVAPAHHDDAQDAEDTTFVIGVDDEEGVSEGRHQALQDSLHATISQGMNDGTRKNYRNRLQKLIEFLEENYKAYCSNGGVRTLTQEEISDRTKFYFGKKKDLVYFGFNVQLLLYFYAATDRRADGKLKSHDDLRKYRDCILWGAKMAGERLPTKFYDSTEVFLRAYKKKIAAQKKLGNVDVFSTDPIPVPVYKIMLRGAIRTNNVFAWTWTILQWNCMARSASIDCLAFHNFRLGTDSIIIKYDDSKADKAGEKLSEKNVYANPLDWIQCPWLALGKFFFCPPPTKNILLTIPFPCAPLVLFFRCVL